MKDDSMFPGNSFFWALVCILSFFIMIHLLAGCASMGRRAGYRAGYRHYFEDKQTRVWSYPWFFHVGFEEARMEWARSKRGEK